LPAPDPRFSGEIQQGQHRAINLVVSGAAESANGKTGLDCCAPFSWTFAGQQGWKSGSAIFRMVDASVKSLRGRTQTSMILGVERAESSFNGLTDPNNTILDVRTE
jgi:hypothetical protein